MLPGADITLDLGGGSGFLAALPRWLPGTESLEVVSTTRIKVVGAGKDMLKTLMGAGKDMSKTPMGAGKGGRKPGPRSRQDLQSLTVNPGLNLPGAYHSGMNSGGGS